MTNVVVIGSQWGDEGKGKVVDLLSREADVIVRFQGGHNAGHTLVIDGKVYKLRLLPSGVVRSKLSIIGNGVVIDPWELLKEIDDANSQGLNITPENLRIAENAPLILPLHRYVERSSEKGKGKIGTTGRGIGPSYEDKIGRRAIRVCDLEHKEILEEKLARMILYHDSKLDNQDELASQILNDLMEVAPRLLSFSEPVWKLLDEASKQGKDILFEGAQGMLLDVDHGTYPFVTSSNAHPGVAAVGSGFGVAKIDYILGITKAYTTRVGNGPFPTELHDDVGQKLGERGHEFGTVTGRARRCGWFDAVAVRQTLKIAGITGIVLTKLDVLDDFEKLKICTSYKCGDKEYDYLPASGKIQSDLTPQYETVEGWMESTEGIRDFDKLPQKAVNYIKRIEELIEVPITIISTSPEREDTIVLKNPF